MTGDPATPSFPAAALLSLCDLFGDVDPAILNELGSELLVMRLRRGEVLIRQGDPAECMYAIVSGRLQLFTDAGDGTKTLIAELRSGETAGEVDLVDGRPSMTTVRVARDCEVVRVTRAGFERIVRTNAESMNKVSRIVARRMRAMVEHKHSTPAIRTIAVLGAGDAAHSLGFGATLAAALETFGPVLHLSEGRFRRIYGCAFDSSGEIAARLSELEGVYRFVVLESDGESPDFTRHSVRQADRVLAVARSSASPRLIPPEQMLFSENAEAVNAPVELVLLHDEPGAFSGTAKWLAGRGVFRHHHIRLGVTTDVTRLARILAGCAVGLALGGGGARGFAHIGIIRALQEAGIPIDMTCGVSMGSIIAAQYAMGWDWQTMIRMNQKVMAGGGLQSDFTLPLVSLSSGRRFRRVLKTFYDEIEIEDLPLSFFCTSCNLSTSEIQMHRTGLLRDAITASNAIPAILPPVLVDGQMLVDGGIVNNLPGDLLKETCGGPVIVSSVSPRKDVVIDQCYTEMPSAWRVLRSRLNPFEKAIRVPGISATMMRALMVASHRKSREVEREADFCLRPPVESFRMDDMGRVEEIAEVGYGYAKAEIRAWKSQGRINVEAESSRTQKESAWKVKPIVRGG